MKYANLDLGTIEAIVNKLGGMDGVNRFLRGELEVKEYSLLRRIKTVPVPAQKRFVAKDHFVVNAGEDARVKISYLGDNFCANFLDKIENPAEEKSLAVSKLLKKSLDLPILGELGDKAETQLSQMFALMSEQPDGEGGTLLTNGAANIFYIRDKNNKFWAVYCYWVGDGWCAFAGSVEYPYEWLGGGRVFSRNS